MPDQLTEAATIRARARALVNAMRALLADKTLPGNLRKQIEGLSGSLRKTWKDLEADAAADPSESLREAANMGNWLESRLHSSFTMLTDDMFGQGYLTREERIGLSSAIGDALDAFNTSVSANLPQLYERRPYDEPVAPADTPIANAAEAAAGEVADLAGDVVPLLESAVRSDGSMAIKLIQPGWGASGFYPAEVLQRDGPNVFKAGTHVYMDHPTMTETRDRPERSVRDLAATLSTPARWDANHPAGPGLYAEAQVAAPYRAMVNELAPHIGMSIRAQGKAGQGEAEGKTGPIISEITAAQSVDVVTRAGAGGEILSLFEARRVAAHGPTQSQEDSMSEQDVKKLQEANALLETKLAEQAAANAAQAQAIARLQEQGLLRQAGEVVTAELARSTLPAITRNRLHAGLAANPPLKDGALDTAALTEKVKEAVTAETAYLAEVAGAGKITGLGGSADTGSTEASRKALIESFKRFGLDDKQAATAAEGR